MPIATVYHHGRFVMLVVVAVSALLFTWPRSVVAAGANRITIDPPGEREFVRDMANMIDPETKKKIVAICDKLLTDKATPIIVVTIDSMAKHGGAGMRIETFATLLFDQWQIGHAKLGNQVWNTGILLLVSKGDRRARIELGAGWKREKDQLCQRIMNTLIIPEFKQGNYSQGILVGVEGLDKMARALKLPTRPRPWWHYGLIAGLIGLAIFTVVSLIRRGSSGWSWLLWSAVFGFVGYMLYQMMTNSSRGGGGGFGGGSFGGGFSGGGGASGSW